VVRVGDGQLLVVASDDDNIRLYNVADPAHPVPVGSPIPSTETVTTLALSPDGRALATSGDGSITRLYDLAAARSTASTTGIRSIAFSPAGHDLRTPPGDSPGSVAAVAWSPDGHTLAAAADDDGIRLFNVTDLTHPTPIGHPLLGHIRSIRALSFTLDGRTLASAGDDDSVRLWDTSDLSNAHELGQPLSESTSSVNAVAWGPNGGILASGGNDNSVRLWDTTDRHNPSVLGAPLTAHTDAVRAVAFNPTGTVLASAARDGTMRLWNLDADEAIHRICIRTANTVGPDEWARLFPNVPFDQPCTDN
jgi:WD40 repeat protein